MFQCKGMDLKYTHNNKLLWKTKNKPCHRVLPLMAGCYQMATSEHFTLENVCCPSDRTFSMPMGKELQLYYKRIFCCLSSGIRPERVKLIIPV